MDLLGEKVNIIDLNFIKAVGIKINLACNPLLLLVRYILIDLGEELLNYFSLPNAV